MQGSSPTGQVVGGNSIKIGFCLIDLYKLDDNAPTSEKTFWDCYTSYQGVSVGWGRPVPPVDRRTAWVEFTLSSESNGNRKVTVTDHSPCEDPGMCGERSTNR